MLSSRPDRVKASFQRVEALTSITYTVSPASECNKPPMSMSFGLATTLSTSQKLTPQMQQAIKLLQLSSLELAQEVQAKLDSNPLLERIEEDEDEYETSNEKNNEAINEFGEPLTLDTWNQNAEADSFTTSSTASNNDDTFEYDDRVSDSLDKLQQASFDDDAIDSYDMDSYAIDSYDGDSVDNSRFDSSNIGSGSTSSALARSDSDDFDSYQGSTTATIQDHVSLS